MDKVEFVGSGWVSVVNINYFGIVGYYVFEFFKWDLIGWVMINSMKFVVFFWGGEWMLGINFIVIVFLGLEELFIVIDMVSSVCVYGKVEIVKCKEE